MQSVKDIRHDFRRPINGHQSHPTTEGTRRARCSQQLADLPKELGQGTYPHLIAAHTDRRDLARHGGSQQAQPLDQFIQHMRAGALGVHIHRNEQPANADTRQPVRVLFLHAHG
ncbi:MAG: hypothetical protein GFH23_1086812n30 [Chloroflexi bacterium AL-N1]|nr:hypothetical protein [Chloroflexi bacterium AL-N1]